MDFRKGLEFCMKCGGKATNKEDNILFCSECGFNYFLNEAAASTALIRNSNRELLLTKRKYEPFQNTWDTPGGFIKPGENLEEGLIREMKEELNIHIEIDRYVGSYQDKYAHEGIIVPTLTVAFTANIVSGKLEARDDITEYRFFPNSEILSLDLAGFDSLRPLLKDYING